MRGALPGSPDYLLRDSSNQTSPALVLMAGLVNTTLQTSVVSPFDLRRIFGTEPHLVAVRGKMAETPSLRVYEEGDRSRWRTLARIQASALRLDKGEWQPAFGRIAVTTTAPMTNLFSGQVVEVFGVAALPKVAVAEGTFDYRHYLEQQGIYYQLTAESESDWLVVKSPPAPPLADRFGVWARRALALGLPSEDESLRLEWALALGWKTALTEDATEPFIRAATYHIFAVDGLRMAIVFGIFFALLRVFGASRPLCGIVLLPVIWFYVALTGWPASAIRASVMLTIIISGWVLRRPNEPINSLLLAALIILVWEPQQLFQAGFQLSFFVVLCLILIIPPLVEQIERATAPDPLLPEQLRKKWPGIVILPARYVADLSVTSFAAWIGSLPLVAYYFNIVTPVSTPANVIAVPLCILVLISNLLSLMFASWFPDLSELFNHAGWFGMECIRVSSQWFAEWPAAYWYTSAPSWFAILFYYALLLGITTGWLFHAKWRLWKWSVVSMLMAVWTWLYVQSLGVTKLTILPVSGGTCLFYDTLGWNRDLLVDVGPTNTVRFITQPFLRAQGVNHLPTLVLTHGDVHHLGGTEPLIEGFGASRICSSPVKFRSVVCRKIIDRLSKCYGVEPISRGQRVGDWTLLHPDEGDQFSRADDAAAVLFGTARGTRILLLSDLGRDGQNTLLQRTDDLRADIVIAGLPASGEPLSAALIAAIDPCLIIISDSEFPATERASLELRGRLHRTNITTLYTRDTGAISLTFHKHTWMLRAANGQPALHANRCSRRRQTNVSTQPASK
jgi:competence protein ComEC